ncbi:hypothetical protein [uncultured Limosilactobacillus sp.]|uniref:hypothetical protein n=1 Tax=uncultured Limosilactobacillus sp. TaxID=2837629 RepID=UPI002597321C|nr:hypothetical protein [uncultured Limosilactobacillus sp.]
MSNKHEIEEELNQAQARLDALCQNEGTVDDRGNQTVVVQPTYGDEMQSLREECSNLQIILEAMEASED